MISVLPICDQMAVTESHVWVRVSCSDRFRSLSEWFQLLSGPVKSLPNALMAAHSTTPSYREEEHVAQGGAPTGSGAAAQVRGNKEHVRWSFLMPKAVGRA